MGYLRPAPLIPILRIARTGDEAARPGRGVLLHFPDRFVDAARNAAWDDLLAHANQAWTWRDRDSLSALAVCLLRLARDVGPEWTGPETDVPAA